MSRRQVRFRCSAELVAKLLVKEVRALPDDLRVVGAHWQPLTASVEMLIESKDFPAVNEGAYPELWEALNEVIS